MKRRFLLAVVSLLIVLGLFAQGYCDQPAARPQGKPIRIGCLVTIEPLIRVLAEGLEAKGYKVDVVLFDANNMPAIATRDGDIDGFIHNHLPWITTFNKESKANLMMMKPYLCYYREALYSKKHKSVDQFPSGAQIAIPNDPANLEKSLLMLQELKLLTLKPKSGPFYTPLDIKDNPKKIRLIETEISTTARSINDADAVICPATRIRAAGIDPNSFIAEDGTTKNFPVGLTVDSKSINEPWVKDAMKVLASDDLRARFGKIFNGTMVLYPKQ